MALSTLVWLGAAPSPSIAAHCDGASPTGAVPATFLRSYRAFFKSPTRLAIDNEDKVYVADPLNGRVVVRAPDGRIVMEMERLGYPVSVAVDSLGNIYVGDGKRGRVDILSRSGEVTGVLGQGDDEFTLPAFMAIHEDADGAHVYVVDTRQDVIKRYRGSSGALEISFGGTGSGDGQLRAPAGIAIAGDELTVVDRGNSRLQVFTADGVFLRKIEPPKDNCGFLCFFEGATQGRPHDTGLWIGAGGAMYLAETSKGRLVVLNNTGTGIGTVGDFGESPGKLRVPTDMVIDSCGRLFVASAANSRLEVFGLPGHVDPEQFAPGRLEVANEPIDPRTDNRLVAYLELPGHRLSEVTDVVANGFAVPVAVAAGDFDRDNIPDLELVFGGDLLSTLFGMTHATITVTGTAGGLRFDESDEVQLVAGTVDADGDGVADGSDLCPGTAVGQPVGSDGCSVAQRCPCDGPAPGAPWANHGQYVQCVVQVADELAAGGAIPTNGKGAITWVAARSDCGKRK